MARCAMVLVVFSMQVPSSRPLDREVAAAYPAEFVLDDWSLVVNPIYWACFFSPLCTRLEFWPTDKRRSRTSRAGEEVSLTSETLGDTVLRTKISERTTNDKRVRGNLTDDLPSRVLRGTWENCIPLRPVLQPFSQACRSDPGGINLLGKNN